MEQRIEELKDYKTYIIDNEFDIIAYKDEKFTVQILSVNHNFYDIKSFKTMKGAKKFIEKLKEEK